MCVTSTYVILEEHWKQAPKDLIVRIVNNITINLNKILKYTNIIIRGENFIFLPHIKKTGDDLLIENNFLNLYQPFTQYVDKISLITLDDETIYVSKIRKALIDQI